MVSLPAFEHGYFRVYIRGGRFLKNRFPFFFVNACTAYVISTERYAPRASLSNIFMAVRHFWNHIGTREVSWNDISRVTNKNSADQGAHSSRGRTCFS